MEEDFSLSEMLITGMELSGALVALSHHEADLQSHAMNDLSWAAIKMSNIFFPYENEN